MSISEILGKDKSALDEYLEERGIEGPRFSYLGRVACEALEDMRILCKAQLKLSHPRPVHRAFIEQLALVDELQVHFNKMESALELNKAIEDLIRCRSELKAEIAELRKELLPLIPETVAGVNKDSE